MGAFASPNRAGVMNSLPPAHRGAGGGMNQTFQNSAQVLSIGIFFTLMILGLSATLPHTLASGLEAHGVAHATAAQIGHLPPVSILFAAFLGYNPAQELLGPHLLHHLSHADAATITGRSFFPGLLSEPFRSGLHEAFGVRDPRLPDRGGRLVVARRTLRQHRARPGRHAGRGCGAVARRALGRRGQPR